MGLKITTEPAYEPITLSEMKVHLAVTNDDQDAYIRDLSLAARQYVERWTERQLVEATYQYTLDRFPTSGVNWGGVTEYRILLPRSPLKKTGGIVSISYIDSDGAPQTLAGSVYEADANVEPPVARLAYGQSWPNTRYQKNAVTVNFIAGYASPAEIPQPLKSAIRLLVAHWFENREAAILGTIVEETPLGVKDLLWAYRLVEIR